MIVSFTNTDSDPRVLRQIKALSRITNLTVYGFGSSPQEPVKFVPFSSEGQMSRYTFLAKVIDGLLLPLRLHSSYYWRTSQVKLAKKVGIRRDCEIYIANDFETLPLVLRVAPKTSRVFLDAHEYTPDQVRLNKWYSQLIQEYLSDWLVSKHIKLVDGMMTVAPGIATAYQEKYGVLRPAVVMNTPNFQHLPVRPTSQSRIRLIHHGVASRSRGLKTLIKLMDELDTRFELNLMLVEGDPGYLDELVALAKVSRRSDDIHFHPPGAVSGVPSELGQGVLGLGV